MGHYRESRFTSERAKDSREQGTENPRVGGSIPPLAIDDRRHFDPSTKQCSSGKLLFSYPVASGYLIRSKDFSAENDCLAVTRAAGSDVALLGSLDAGVAAGFPLRADLATSHRRVLAGRGFEQ
jgi:hypothetical protein